MACTMLVSSLTNSAYILVWHPKAFADVEHHWSKDAMNDMASRMIVKGVSDTGYKPDQSITRAEFAAIMVRALGLVDNRGTAPFRDVRANDWFAGAVAKAHEYGLIQGFGDGAFRPLDTITRQEAVAILSRVMKWTGLPGGSDTGKTLSRFADSGEVAAWARGSFAAAVEHRLVQGNEGLLNPNGELTRAEAAALVQRLLRKSGLIH
ncbi:MAG: hypothetical protein C6W59_08660 [Paenibacillaceae bacterium]|nr:MAG: hypothetical protein C6W59_08660 [Paenibacillaceae bacterium]